MAAELTVARERLSDGALVAVRGVVDLAATPRLHATLRHAAAPGEALTVDLSQVAVADATALALLVNTVRRLRAVPRRLLVVCPPGPIRAALHRSAVDCLVQVLDDRGVAEEALGGDRAESQPGGVRAIAARAPRRQRRSTPGRRGALLAEATVVIEARHSEPDLGLEEVARHIATSPRQLQRVFAELANTTFRDELGAVRMQHAAELLQAGDMPVGAIARRVGHRQAAQFAKAFRRHYGVSPTASRRAARAADTGRGAP